MTKEKLAYPKMLFMKPPTILPATRLVSWIFVVLLALFNLAPVIWMISVSLKTKSEIFSLPVTLLPKSFALENYSEVLKDPRMVRYFINSILVTLSSTGLCVILGIFAGYGFSRYVIPGKNILLSYVLYSTVLPRIVIITPLYILLVKMGLHGTYQGIIFSYLAVTLSLAVWLFSVFFDTIPVELEEAARIDGCGTLLMIWKIIIPLLAPCIFAVFMYSFVLAWNEYLLPLIIATDKTAPITVGLARYEAETLIHWGNIMAASFLMTVPTLIIFMIFVKHLVSGLAAGAIK